MIVSVSIVLHLSKLVLLRLVRLKMKELNAEYDKTEEDLKSLQSVGQIIGEVLRQLDEDRCAQFVTVELKESVIYENFSSSVIVKASSGPRYVVGCRNKVDKSKLVSGTRVALDMTTLTIMRSLPREVG